MMDMATAPTREEKNMILLERRGKVRLVTINRPEKRNSVNLAAQRRLLEVLEEVAADDDVRALVLTGAGSAFCAGGDRGDLMASAEGRLPDPGEFARISDGIVNHLLGFNFPTIAALNGAAAGFGASLVAMCDVVIASEQAAMWDPHVHFGVPSSVILVAIWSRLTSRAVAKELLLTGRKVQAPEALELGLVNRVCPAGEELAAAMKLAESFVAMPAAGVNRTKQTFNRALIDEVNELMRSLHG
jgi:enoyl-CoA hydratase